MEQLSLSDLVAHAARLTQDRFYQIDVIDKIGADRLDKASYISQLLYGQVHLVPAEQMWLRALTGYEKGLGPHHMLTLGMVNGLGMLYGDRGDLEKAEQMFLQALTLGGKALGPYHTSILEIVNNLGVLYSNRYCAPNME